MDSKSILTSASFQGLAVMILSLIAQKAGWKLDAAGVVTQVMTIVGACYALYGIVRRKDIHVLPPSN